MTDSGDHVNCSTGVMQGCPFASVAFALLVKWLVAQMRHSGLDKTQFFMDDGLLYGTPEAMKWCLDLIEKLESTSGLKLKWKKMSVHALDSAYYAQLWKPENRNRSVCGGLSGREDDSTSNGNKFAK